MVQIARGYRTELNPNKTQVVAFKKACGTARFAYDRVYRCDVCGLVMDRDLNAAKNLEWYATTVAGSSPETLNACGETGGHSQIGSARRQHQGSVRGLRRP